uniref:Uncharacterized protein n=1 Tax=Nomascus leucogenys TaxID=61853 RepID=A0A2I3HSM5_NOMLE
MVLLWLLLETARRAVLGSAEAALCGLTSIKGNHHNFYTAISKDVTYKELKNLSNSKKFFFFLRRKIWEIRSIKKFLVDEVGEALQMNPRDFKEKYNEVKSIQI